MSFGLLKHFKKNKDEAQLQTKETHQKYLVLGSDLGGVLKLLDLKREHPTETIKLVSNRLITKQMLLETYEFGLSSLRSPEKVESLYRKYHGASILPQKMEPTFYKDGKFHDFGGRAKPMELLNGEMIFTQKAYRFKLASFFRADDWENLDQILSESLDIRHLESIEKTTPQDLVDIKEWRLHFKDFTSMSAQYLFVAMTPKKFIQYVHHKETLTSHLVDLCTSVNLQGGISVTWVMNGEVSSEEKTIFLPQSMTHEWGHFLVEFEPYKYETKTQLVHALILIHEEEPQAEDLASKIKLLKRVIDRVFPKFEEKIAKEYIRFDDEMFINDMKEEAKEQVNFDYPTLNFVERELH